MVRFWRFWLIWLAMAAPLRAASPAEICEYVALQVAAETGVPADILGALTLTETGRRHDGRLRPWAWAVNAEGAGTWFDDPAQALHFAQSRVAAGRPNVDIGCFQINFRWHGQHFASLEEMFDPLQNGRYAAHFLTRLHAETGDWRAAAGAFHSRRPEDARRYLARFDQLHAMLQQRGFQGMQGAAGSYNDFAVATAASPPAIPGVIGPRRERVMLLGAPLGTAAAGGGPGGAASLAVMGGARDPLTGGARGALVALGPDPAGQGASLWR
ncbi:MAG: hypothetical protein Q4G14_10650 [Paracoccus sp. (in: a-proteobacteria)]|uniref:hypothetical protein n=1 Tax=Paracoccus sp. TaxID=267 RepID=UPI0026E09A43|nr:hypothetical protein [Paracoccus sp. (in: a-proteobacteria)]MDO5613683.1 hypothetical protein [Paracoccus sp. (in: a-proteobacteria)]